MTNRRSNNPRRRKGKGQWSTRVSGAFAAWWRAQKSNRRLGQISDEKESQKAFDQNFKESALASRQYNQELNSQDSLSARVSNAILAPLDGEVWPWPIGREPRIEPKSFYVQNPEADSIFRSLVFLKYGLTFRELISQVETDPKAHRKLLNIHRDWYRLRWGKVSPEGLKLKFSLDHFGIILQGLDFGLDKLNEWDLADCLDDICPCPRHKHSVDYLKKLRTRIVKTVMDLVARES